MNHASARSPNAPDAAALVAQLAELNERVRLYAAQAWQMPFAYLAATGISLVSANPKGASLGLLLVTSGFIIFGFTILWAISTMMRRITEIVRDIIWVERALHLPETVKNQRPLPYYLMTGTGMIVNLVFLLRAL